MHLRIFTVRNDTAFKLCDILKTFMKEKAGQFFAADATCTIGQHFFVLKLTQVIPNPLRKFAEGFHLRADRTTEMADIIFIVISTIYDDNIIILQLFVELFRG
ncbi:hypothetical protein D3C78_1608400 [compost metagenome]